MACRIRVAARMFESGLEDPETAVSACLLALEELHGLPAIQEMFKVFLNGGMRSWLNKAERLENIMSVLFMNHALFDFAAKCSSKYPNVFSWPRIKLADRTFHPIVHVYDIVEKTTIGEEFGQQLYRMVVDKRISDVVDPHVRALALALVHVHARGRSVAVNSRGEIILLDDEKITVIYSSGESKDVMFSDLSESNVVAQEGKAVAVENDDNVYILRYLKTRRENSIKQTFVLCVLDGNYNIKHDSTALNFLNAGERDYVRIVADKNKNTVFMKLGENQVFVCDSRVKLRFKFEGNGSDLADNGVTNNNEIMVRSRDMRTVYVYTTEGNLKSTI